MGISGHAFWLWFGLLLPTIASEALAQVTPPKIVMSFGAPSIPLNGGTTVTFVVTNPGTATLNNVGFTDALPAGLIVATPNGLNGACGSGMIRADMGSNTVMLSGFTATAGASCTFSVNVTATTVGTKYNQVTVSSNQGTGNTSYAVVQ